MVYIFLFFLGKLNYVQNLFALTFFIKKSDTKSSKIIDFLHQLYKY